MSDATRKPITDDLFSQTRHTIKIPGNGIAGPGVDAIMLELLRWGLPSLPFDWCWDWRVGGKGEYVGTLPKRIGKFYYQKHGTKLTPDQLTVIGNLGAQHSNRDETYHFDIVDRIDWEAGDFGDRGSCFWSCHASAKDMILDNGGGAVRFFYQDDSDRGLARAWVATRPDGCLLVFNGYGMETLPIVRILAAHFDHSYYRKVDLKNYGSSDGNLWINNGTGYLIGPQAVVTTIDAIDLGWEELETCRCANCEESINEDDHYHSPDGADYCEECYHNRVFYCDTCNEDCWTDDARSAPGDDGMICESCYTNSVRYCKHCQEDMWESDAMEDPDGVSICASCHSDKIAVCVYCDTGEWSANIKEDPDGDFTCRECFTDRFTYCNDCQEVTDNAATQCDNCRVEEGVAV